MNRLLAASFRPGDTNAPALPASGTRGWSCALGHTQGIVPLRTQENADEFTACGGSQHREARSPFWQGVRGILGGSDNAGRCAVGAHRLRPREGRRNPWRRSESEVARSVAGDVLRRQGQRQGTAQLRPARVPARVGVRSGQLQPAQEAACAPLHARDLGADLRDLQDLPGHPGQVHPVSRSVHRGHHHRVLRRAARG